MDLSPINYIQIHIEVGKGQISTVKKLFDTKFECSLPH